jgi:very-short-patch-repair endonuclease/DNA polymerase III delta prime subunit
MADGQTSHPDIPPRRPDGGAARLRVVGDDFDHAASGRAESASNDDSENARLATLFDKLRSKLLDLTLRNPMLNYRPQSRSRRHLQIVDDAPEDIFKRVTTDPFGLDLIALPEPSDIPEDERNDEFESQLAYLKSTDVEYLTALTALVSRGYDNEFEVAKLDRSLRDVVRSKLGLQPRPQRKQLDLAEHARQHKIDPSIELPKDGERAGVRRRRLQTLLLPENLQARLDTIQDLARLSEQEMGLSTLFLAFGFLEWYQAEDSEKANFAPLLLLPVSLQTQTEGGKKVYRVKATSEAPEINVTLAKYVEDLHLSWPEFEPDDDSSAPVETYFSQVAKAIDGVQRWKLRRFAILGHFAFGRLAMYQDIDPEKWPGGPAAHRLVGSVLRGTEAIARDQGDALPRAPEDYNIDTPEVECLAPLLIHDADASQHSAIVDVMKGENLVIEGPPGTGKSQTIANIIANALSKDSSTTVLFLSEKLAALEVVKRRLDSADLGHFCLELHSEKSSPKTVIESLKNRCDFHSNARAPQSLDVRTWRDSRADVSQYLAALHSRNDDDSAFELFWRAIAADSKHSDLPNNVRNAPIPDAVLSDPNEQRYLENEMSLFGSLAEAFNAGFGSAADSPWAAVAFDAKRGQSEEIIQSLEDLDVANSKLLELTADAASAGLSLKDVFAIAENVGELKEPPDLAGVEIIATANPNHVRRAADACDDLRLKEEQLAADPLNGLDSVKIAAAHRVAASLWDSSLLEVSFAEVSRQANEMILRSDKITGRIDATKDIRNRLKLGDDFPVDGMTAALLATFAAAAAPTEKRPWLSWQPAKDVENYRNVQTRWSQLSTNDHSWTTNLSGYNPGDPPEPTQVRQWADLIDNSYAAFKPWGRDSWKQAKAAAAALGVESAKSDTAATLRAFAAHLEAIKSFEQDSEAANAIGPLWNGMKTDFAKMDWALKSQSVIRDKFADQPEGAKVAEILLQMDKTALDELAAMKDRASLQRSITPGDANFAAGASIAETLIKAAQDRRTAKAVLSVDPGATLGQTEAPLKAILAYSNRLDARQKLVDEIAAIPAGNTVQAMINRPGDSDHVHALAHWIETVRAACLPTTVHDRLVSPAGARALVEVKALVTRASAARDELSLTARHIADEYGTELSNDSPEGLKRLLEELLGHRHELPDFLDQANERRILERAGLGPFLKAIERTQISPNLYADVLSYVLTRRRAERARKGSRILSDATGARLNARRKQFAEQDKLRIAKDRADASAALMRRTAQAGSSYGPKKHWTEMALLENEMKKEQRFASVRTLLRQAPASIRALKPCFMMSPLSVGKFLPRDMHFDLVIIDEASQMRPEDALGALLRTDQIIVVGDPKQLPPTDFFNRALDGSDTDDEDDDDIKDESILEACSKSFNKVRHLKWHYRSRCESLIAFSNEQFYKTLITFPMARPGSFSIDLVNVDGIYEAKQNAAEAQRICEEAIDLMGKLADASKEDFGTIGVVAVNSDQRDRILEEFRRLSAGNAAVERFMERAADQGEPFIVKNLENIQGDERDFIMISLTYGRLAGKKTVNQTFGPINRSQGHRRLNVLFSRARRRIGLFTSMHSSDIRPSETSKRGVHILKSYLEYAERGRTGTGSVTGKPYDSSFEAEVAERLTTLGFRVDAQVGVSGFRIDLAVQHREHPSVYVAGIECDGATYHSSKSARDRDRLREEVLRGLGWEIVRIWSTDWFADPDAATNRLIEQIKILERKPLRNVDEVVFGGWSSEEPGHEPYDETLAPTAPSPIDKTTPPSDISSVVATAATQLDIFAMPPATPTADVPTTPSLLQGSSKLTRAQAQQALVELRGVIEAEMPNAEPHRCILRDKMIDHFLNVGFTDPQDWFDQVPAHLREGCDPTQKRQYLDRICDVIDRVAT